MVIGQLSRREPMSRHAWNAQVEDNHLLLRRQEGQTKKCRGRNKNKEELPDIKHLLNSETLQIRQFPKSGIFRELILRVCEICDNLT